MKQNIIVRYKVLKNCKQAFLVKNLTTIFTCIEVPCPYHMDKRYTKVFNYVWLHSMLEQLSVTVKIAL